ncbi:MAG: hypothetical protein CMJ18_01575 [Phycisphaeraceae bacterium]|nr:hypothetical protein [Phycisphaeraceae bacterium]
MGNALRAETARLGTDAASRRGRHPSLNAGARPIEDENEDADDCGKRPGRNPGRGPVRIIR